MSDVTPETTPGEEAWKEEQGIDVETPSDSDATERATADEDDSPESNVGDTVTPEEE